MSAPAPRGRAAGDRVTMSDLQRQAVRDLHESGVPADAIAALLQLSSDEIDGLLHDRVMGLNDRLPM